MAAPPSDAAPPGAPGDALAAEGLGFAPPGGPPTLTPDVPAAVLLQSGDTPAPPPPPAPPPAPAAEAATEFTPPGIPPTPDAAAAATAAPDAGSFAPPPMPSEQAPETAR